MLVRDCSPRIRPHLRRFARTDADADDLLQELWLRVYRKRATFQGRGSFFGWLLMVSRTVGMAAIDRRRREPPTGELRDAPDRIGPDAMMLGDMLRNAVLDLPPRQRDVLMLRLIDGRSTAETAQLLRCAQGTVKATLHQATRRLQQLLKETVP